MFSPLLIFQGKGSSEEAREGIK